MCASGPLHKQQLGARAAGGLRWRGRGRSGIWSGCCSCRTAYPLGSTALLERPPPTGCPRTCMPACLPPTAMLIIRDREVQQVGRRGVYPAVQGSYLHAPASAEQSACSKTSTAVKLRLCRAMQAQTAYTYCIPKADSFKCALKQKIVYTGTQLWALASLFKFTVGTNSAPKRESKAGTLSNAWNAVSYLNFWQPCSGLARAPRLARLRAVLRLRLGC